MLLLKNRLLWCRFRLVCLVRLFARFRLLQIKLVHHLLQFIIVRFPFGNYTSSTCQFGFLRLGIVAQVNRFGGTL